MPAGAAALVAAGLLAAGCSSSPRNAITGPGSGTPGPGPGKPADTTGFLSVTVTLGPQASGKVTVTGPGNFQQVLTASTVLTKLAPGSYTLATDSATVADSIVGSIVVRGSVSASAVTVAAKDTAKVSATFTSQRFGGLVIDGFDSSEVLEVLPSQLGATATVTPGADIGATVGQPSASTLDASGNLWVASFQNNSLSMFTPAQRAAANGAVTPTVVITGPALARPFGIAVDSHGTVWVTNVGNSTLVGYTAGQVAASGSPTPAVTLSDTTAAHRVFNSPAGIAFDHSGNLWVSNNGGVIDEFTPAELAASGVAAPTDTITNGTIEPDAVAFDGAGNLWVSGYNGAIAEYAPGQLTASGSPTPAVLLSMSASGAPPHPWGVAFDRRGYLWTVSADTAGATAPAAAYGFAPSQLAASGAPTPTTVVTINSTHHATGSLGLLFDPYVLMPGDNPSMNRAGPPYHGPAYVPRSVTASRGPHHGAR